MDASGEPRLHVDGVTVTPADVALLRAVDEQGSLNAASDALGRSYSRAHGRLTDLEAALGSLVERERGGPGGGGSTLTADARTLLARFARLRATLAGATDRAETVLTGTVARREGELVTVATDIGPVGAVLSVDAADVQVVVPADAVTLHAPGDAPGADATSARNRFSGTVAKIDREPAITRVSVAVADTTLYALVTTESADRLTLAPGTAVVASFKTTAARATRRA
jgi:molybdate transport system regulatory protein